MDSTAGIHLFESLARREQYLAATGRHTMTTEELETAYGTNAAIDRGLAGARWARRYTDASEEESAALDRMYDPPDEEDCYEARTWAPRAYAAAYHGSHVSALKVQASASAAHGRLLMLLDAREERMATRVVDECAAAMRGGTLRRPSVSELAAASPASRAAYLTASEGYGSHYRAHRLALVRAVVAVEAVEMERRMRRSVDTQSAGLEARIAAVAERSILGEVRRLYGLVDWSDVQATREVEHPSEAALAVQQQVLASLRNVSLPNLRNVSGTSVWTAEGEQVPLKLETSVVAARYVDGQAWREVVHVSACVGASPGEVHLDVVVDGAQPIEEEP